MYLKASHSAWRQPNSNFSMHHTAHAIVPKVPVNQQTYSLRLFDWLAQLKATGDRSSWVTTTTSWWQVRVSCSTTLDDGVIRLSSHFTSHSTMTTSTTEKAVQMGLLCGRGTMPSAERSRVQFSPWLVLSHASSSPGGRYTLQAPSRRFSEARNLREIIAYEYLFSEIVCEQYNAIKTLSEAALTESVQQRRSSEADLIMHKYFLLAECWCLIILMDCCVI